MKSVLHEKDAIYSRRHFPSWLLLAAVAGSVNALAYLATERFASHVTGAVTQLGLASLWLALDLLIIFAAFVAGASFAACAIDVRAAREKPPLYALPLHLSAGLIGGVGALGLLGVFGPFGGDGPDLGETLLLAVLGFAMGLQNGAVATSTGLVVRTTHMTGAATDLGLQLAQLGVPKGDKRREARRMVALRGGKIAAFVLGAGATVPLARSLEYAALFVPAVVTFGVTLVSFTAFGMRVASTATHEHEHESEPGRSVGRRQLRREPSLPSGAREIRQEG